MSVENLIKEALEPCNRFPFSGRAAIKPGPCRA